jgi:sphingoid base N-palmitoyltransferase
MFAHHLVTISLMIFSIICNFARIGCLILVIHDSADYWLEFAKVSLYAKKKIICDTGIERNFKIFMIIFFTNYVFILAFGMFTLVWFVTRLVIFPTRFFNFQNVFRILKFNIEFILF